MEQELPAYFTTLPYQAAAATGLVIYSEYRPDTAKIEASVPSPPSQETGKKKGFWSRMPDWLEVLMVQPNLFGLGVNFNALLRSLFSR